ncbi:hypothetical protein PC116_g6822 [Phytophthora cactorum]|nr:hypothetical protein PC112_g4139 [Phytophthora cactorum]KAG4245395.1 hypothetical protein PC116_g6822 [Phytophthora cactorum]
MAVETRTLALLAPVYPDVCSPSHSTPVELQRTADDWLKLVFSASDGNVEKEASCINSHDGCRCDYVRLLRALMVLSETDILTVSGEYVVATIDNKAVATLEMHHHADIGESLKDFQLVFSHLQMEGLSIARRSEKLRKTAWKSGLLDATCSSCHVVGCRLHSWEADDILGPKTKLHLPDVFQSLMTHMEAEQFEIRDDVTFVTQPENTDKPPQITDLPRNAMHIVVCMMEAKELAALSGVCSLFRHLAYEVVPGLNLSLRLVKEWKLHRPASELEKRMPERYGFEDAQRYTDGTIRGEVSSLLTVHWVRVIVDEGHKLGGQTPTNLMRMARILSAERRWVMTGTPTPNTLQSADLRFMHGLLVFLRNKPFGQPDGRAWTKAIARPFEKNEPIGFYRLQNVLSRIMMRHTKESIREILPEPIRHTVYIDPTPSEYAQYNVVAAAVRANLVITNLDPHVPGKQHLDSLLNPINRKDALQVVSNLRFACCGGVNSEVLLSNKNRLETINMLTELEVDRDNIATVAEYLRRVMLPGMTTKCDSCERKLQLLMIVPCGHLCCADCVEDRFNEVGPSCFHCNEVFDPEVFQELQPGFEFREIDDANDKKHKNNTRDRSGRPQQQENCSHNRQKNSGRSQNVGQALQNSVQDPSRLNQPNRHYWMVDASKIFYAATRVRELKKEFARRSVTYGVGVHSRGARYVKVIIFSQFTEMIWRTKLAFEQQNILTANFITRVSPKTRMKSLKRFRTDPLLNVLLLSEMGSHGLDLSFVTHVFLMEEIWDKSLEQQVFSRAHRMGAQQAVVVEQLWMKGSVESEMAKVNELDENEVDPPRVFHDLGPPARTRKRKRSGRNALLNVAGKKKRKRNQGDAKKVPTGNKNSFLQRKLDYVLNHFRLLDSNVAAEPR